MELLFMPERLKKIREDRGLNKAEAARLLGLSKMGYLRYESADRTPSHQTVVFMAQKLGTSPDYLIGTTEDPEPKEYVISDLRDKIESARSCKHGVRSSLSPLLAMPFLKVLSTK